MMLRFLHIAILPLLAHHAALVVGSEFGREGNNSPQMQRNRVIHPMYAAMKPNDRDRIEAARVLLSSVMEDSLAEIFASRSAMELSMSVSMSMSMPLAPAMPTPHGTPSSPSTPTVQSPSVQIPSGTMVPTPATVPPTFTYEPSMTGVPIDTTSASPSFLPSEELSLSPSGTSSPTFSFEPSGTNEPSLSPESAPATPVSDPPTNTGGGASDNNCPDNGLALGVGSDNSTTPVFLAVGYRVESTSTTGSGAFANQLQEELIDTAIEAVLGCPTDATGRVFPQTLEVAICVSATGAPSCFVMETEAVMFFTGPINEDQAVFEAYSALQKSMSNDTYVGLVPTVVLVEYLSPSPLPVPPGGETGGGSPIPVESERSTGANPWTIGASAAAVMGGFVSVLVWARARRTRQRRQQLQEETFHSNAQGADGSFPNAQQV